MILGWKITNRKQHPDYWLGRKPIPGGQSANDLVAAQEKSVRNNAIIVASPGSGKSFFVGRLAEEILLRTNSRLLILDPNSDFVRINTIVSQGMWTKAKYDPHYRDAQPLPHEKNRMVFKRPWDRKEKRVYSASARKPSGAIAVALDWLDYPIEWFSDDPSLASENELRSCHSFVKEIAHLFLKSKTITWRSDNELLEFARDFWMSTKKDSRSAVVTKLYQQFASDAPGSSFRTRQCPLPRNSKVEHFEELIGPHIKAAARYRTFMLDKAQRDYFNVAQAAKASRVFGVRFPLSNPVRAVAHVVDLLSIQNPRFRLMVVRKYLQDELSDAVAARELIIADAGKRGSKDTRKPLFIIVDEAHNLMPADPETKAGKDVRDQFRTIAAEGRKFGIFLILVTQEPAKLDARVVSLCPNRAMMRMNGGDVLKSAVKLLGLSGAQITYAKQASAFLQGRVMLFGPWAGGSHRFLYGAMRRTPDGGGNLP